MKFGIIGSSHAHITAFVRDMQKSGHVFTGVYDDGTRMSADIAKNNNVPLMKTKDELFAAGVEIMGTAHINSLKIDVIEECESHGVHVMADKPAAVNYEQYERLKKVVENNKIQIGLMLDSRFSPRIQTAKRLVDEGKIGKLISLEIFNPHKLRLKSREAWKFDKEQNGGIIIDLLVHSIDLFEWFTGSRIKEFNGVAAKSILEDKPGFYDSTQFMVLSRDGISGYFRTDWHMPLNHWAWGDLRIFCTGSHGLIEARTVGDPITKKPMVILYGNEEETQVVPEIESGVTATTDLINRIEGRSYILSHEDILEATRLSIEFDKNARKIHL